MSQRKRFITIHEALLHSILARPSLAETQFWVGVKRLKCVKYEPGKISSSVDTPPFCGHDKDHVFLAYWMECTPLEGIGSGNPFRESGEVTLALPHRMCVPLFTWLVSDYWQPGAILVIDTRSSWAPSA